MNFIYKNYKIQINRINHFKITFVLLLPKLIFGNNIEKVKGKLMHAITSAAVDDRSAYLESVFGALDRIQAIIEFSLDGRIINANANFLHTVG